MALRSSIRAFVQPASNFVVLLACFCLAMWASFGRGQSNTDSTTAIESGPRLDQSARAKRRSIKKSAGVRELCALLAQELDASEFKEPMVLRDFLKKMTAHYRAVMGVEVLFRADQTAFLEEALDAPDIMVTSLSFPQIPRKQSGAQLLNFALAQTPARNAAFIARPGFVEITTIERLYPGALLSQRIAVHIQGRPLHLALDDLFDQTGVPVVLDRRVGILARTPISLHIARETSLGTIVFLMSETANLKMIILHDVIVITTPALAQQMLWEHFLRTYQLPDWVNRMGSCGELGEGRDGVQLFFPDKKLGG